MVSQPRQRPAAPRLTPAAPYSRVVHYLKHGLQQGRWPTEVRPFTRNRSHKVYRVR